MKILVTGGLGYIGSHTVVELLEKGHETVIVDDFSNSSIEVLNRIAALTGKRPTFYQLNILDDKALDACFSQEKVDAVIHFAAFKAVGESVSQPLKYYENNVSGTLVLLNVMRRHNVKHFVFSSSATVYGDPDVVPILETAPLSTTNPYGTTKLFIEQILRDVAVADTDWNIVILRYFNPIGAHKSGLMGEDPQGIPNNLIPYVTQVAVGVRSEVSVFGGDYDTPDGTGVRDYIHVVDLAKGHVVALEKTQGKPDVRTYNLGTGQGYSVLEIIQAFEKVSGKTIPYQIVARRPGDIAVCYADATKAKVELGWEATQTLQEMAEDSWRWQEKNPNGYDN